MIKSAAAATLVLVVVAGCSDPEPKEPKPSDSPTPTVTVPTMPPQAKENSPEGAAAFVGHYVKVLNYASQTGDVGPLSKLSDPRCSGCQKYIELYRRTYADGGSFSGGNWTLGEMRVKFGQPETYVTAPVTISAGTVSTAPSETPLPEEASKSLVSFGLSGRPWTVTQFGSGETK